MSFKIINTTILISLINFLSSCASYNGDLKYTKMSDLPYTSEKQNQRLIGDLYISKSFQKNKLVVLVHGGGWRSRSKEDMSSIAKSLASNGFHVFNINYRLAPEHKHPAPVVDLGRAIEYLKKNKEQLNFEFESISLWGYSSGGHTVSIYGLQNPEDIRKVVSGGAPYDLTWYEISPYTKRYLGAYRDEMYDEYIQASPVYLIGEKAPEFFLYHSLSDELVEYAHAANFETRLKQKGHKATVHWVSFWGHINTFLFSRKAIKAGVEFLSI